MPDIGGIPYVDSSDLVSGWPTVSQSVAQEVSDQLASKLDLAGGKILQVVQTVKTDVFSSSSQSMVDVTGLSVSITPSASDSKVLIMCSFVIGSNTNTIEVNLVRDSTAIGQSTGGSSNQTVITQADGGEATSSSIMFLDSPATTSATTYKIQARNASIATFYIGRGGTGSSRAAISTITVMEVSA